MIMIIAGHCLIVSVSYLKKIYFVFQILMSKTDKFTESELNFKVLTSSDYDEIKKFLELYFFPEEPVARSTKLLEGTGLINRYISGLVKRHMMDPCLKDGTSVAAYNNEGEIIGAKYLIISTLCGAGGIMAWTT